jgi:hypothetical protein
MRWGQIGGSADRSRRFPTGLAASRQVDVSAGQRTIHDRFTSRHSPHLSAGQRTFGAGALAHGGATGPRPRAPCVEPPAFTSGEPSVARATGTRWTAPRSGTSASGASRPPSDRSARGATSPPSPSSSACWTPPGRVPLRLVRRVARDAHDRHLRHPRAPRDVLRSRRSRRLLPAIVATAVTGTVPPFSPLAGRSAPRRSPSCSSPSRSG